MHADMKKTLVEPTSFTCSAAFDETCTNEILYTTVGKPMVRLAANGGHATLITLGQTGSGKSHTITGIEEHVASDIFKMIYPSSQQVKIQFIALLGDKKCQDLIGDGRVEIVDNEDGSVQLINAKSVSVDSPEELHKAILSGKHRRASMATNTDASSSRSHTICQITIEHKRNVSFCVLVLLDANIRHTILMFSRISY
jgi:kinesin family protein 2/24